MSLVDKKDIERFYLDSFLGILNLTPSDVQHRESPDFIVVLGGKKIGIELTYFHSDLKGIDGTPRRAIEETWKSLQKAIMKEVKKHNQLDGTYGILFFKHLEVPPKRLHERFAHELIQLSLDMVESGRVEAMPGTEFPLLRKYLKNFLLRRPGLKITWDWNRNASSVGLTEKELIDIIRPKVEGVINYRRVIVDELWLLVVSGYRLSQAMGMLLANDLFSYENLNRLLEQSGYNKVYLYQYMLDVIFEWPGWTETAKNAQ
jgi:hypothetical protein